MNIVDFLQDPIVTAIIGLFAPLLLTLIPGLGAMLKIFPRSFWEAAGKAVGFTVTWPASQAAGMADNLRMELSQLRASEGWHDCSTSVGRAYQEKSAEYAAATNQASALAIDGGAIKQWLPIIAIVGAIFFLTQQDGGCKKIVPKPPAVQGEKAAGVAPAADLTAAAAPIRAIASKNPEPAKRVGRLYAATAEVLRRDARNQRIATTGQLREYLSDADSLYIAGTDLAGSLPGFGESKDAVLDVAVGSRNDMPLVPAMRERVAQGLDAVALALGA